MKIKQGCLAGLTAVSLLACVRLANGASVTIITHGFDPTGQLGGIPNWVDGMADAIATRIDPTSAGSTVSQYELHVTGSDSHTLTKVKGPNPGTSGNQMNVIVKVNWASLSHELGTADKAGRRVAQALLTVPTDGTYLRSFVELPLHFIGHSRGTYVNSAAIQALAREGVWVSHCTTLDGQAFGTDGTLGNWTNIRFADNYYQKASSPTGIPLTGAFNMLLENLQDTINFLSRSFQTRNFPWLANPDSIIWGDW